MNSKEIGDFIKERRKILRIQQQDLAEISGLSLRTVTIVENGEGNPSIQTMQKLADALGLELKLTVKLK